MKARKGRLRKRLIMKRKNKKWNTTVKDQNGR